MTLAGEQGFVGMRAARLDPPICRNGLSGGKPNPIAGNQSTHAKGRRGSIGFDALDGLRQSGRQVAQARQGALAGHRFKPAANQQKGDEHGEGVEPDLPVAACNRGTARNEGDRDAQSNRHVHANASLAQVFPGIAKEGAGSKDQHRQAQGPFSPGQQAHDVGRHLQRRRGVARHGVHHDLHHAQGGDQHPPQRDPSACLLGHADGIARDRSGPIAQTLDALKKTGQRLRVRQEHQPRAARGGIDRDRLHRVAQGCFDVHHTGRAVHAINGQYGFEPAGTIGSRRQGARDFGEFGGVVQQRKGCCTGRRGCGHRAAIIVARRWLGIEAVQS